MIIKILQEKLVNSLSKTSRVISSRTQLPVLQNVLLTTENGLLRVTATNLETTVTALIAAKVEQEGSLCVPAKLFLELVTSIPEETIVLSEIESGLAVETTRTKAQLPVVPYAEFPPVTLVSGKNQLTLKSELVDLALKSVLYAAATDEGRPLLTGVKIISEDESLLFVATDGYRLSLKRVFPETTGDLNMVIPARALTELHRSLEEEKKSGNIAMERMGEGQLGFVSGDTQILTRLIDGEYPAFSRIIPKAWTTNAVVDRDELQRAVKSASIFARDSANIVRFKIDRNLVEVSANTPQVGKNAVTVDAKVEGDGGEIAFNSRFVTDLLNNFDGEEILFEMTGSLNPGVFKIPGNETFLHIIMPVRVQG
jgi:DNA polymerase-3 subunit beta